MKTDKGVRTHKYKKNVKQNNENENVLHAPQTLPPDFLVLSYKSFRVLRSSSSKIVAIFALFKSWFIIGEWPMGMVSDTTNIV
jgi:hypothetical protein